MHGNNFSIEDRVEEGLGIRYLETENQIVSRRRVSGRRWLVGCTALRIWCLFSLPGRCARVSRCRAYGQPQDVRSRWKFRTRPIRTATWTYRASQFANSWYRKLNRKLDVAKVRTRIVDPWNADFSQSLWPTWPTWNSRCVNNYNKTQNHFKKRTSD